MQTHFEARLETFISRPCTRMRSQAPLTGVYTRNVEMQRTLAGGSSRPQIDSCMHANTCKHISKHIRRLAFPDHVRTYTLQGTTHCTHNLLIVYKSQSHSHHIHASQAHVAVVHMLMQTCEYDACNLFAVSTCVHKGMTYRTHKPHAHTHLHTQHM